MHGQTVTQAEFAPFILHIINAVLTSEELLAVVNIMQLITRMRMHCQ